jgi:glycosyltransferase involved in cell wall biosynthesis
MKAFAGSSMKILQIVCYFYPAWAYGGPPRNVYELSKALIKRGHQVSVYTTDAFDKENRVKEKQEVADGIEIRRFRNISNYVAFHHRIFITPGMISAIKNNIKKYDIVHLNDFRTLQNLLAYHYARKYDIPYVLQARGSLVNIITKKRLKQLFDIIGGYRLLRDASRLIALAPLEAEDYKKMGVTENKVDIVPNGIDLAQFENLPNRGSFKQQHGLSDINQVILYLGRVHERKGVDLLISAFSDLTKEFNDARLVIAGPDDGYLSALKSLTKELGLNDRVLFVGGLYGEDKLAAYVDADVYALTSSNEAFGVTILEAMACGTPVVVSDDCGIADIINTNAGLVSPHKKEPLAQALRTLIVDEKLQQQFSQNGKVLVQENFSWTNIAKQMEQAYQKCFTKN